MRTTVLLAAVILLSSCSSLKRVPADSPPPPSKPGITWGGSPIGKFEVQKGFWCDVRARSGLIFGQSGPTEGKATDIAREKCQSVYKSDPCDQVTCKPN
jgi:hypothetical protein